MWVEGVPGEGNPLDKLLKYPRPHRKILQYTCLRTRLLNYPFHLDPSLLSRPVSSLDNPSQSTHHLMPQINPSSDTWGSTAGLLKGTISFHTCILKHEAGKMTSPCIPHIQHIHHTTHVVFPHTCCIPCGFPSYVLHPLCFSLIRVTSHVLFPHVFSGWLVLEDISTLLGTKLDRQALSLCTDLLEQGAPPEALAAILRELMAVQSTASY